MLSPCVNNGAKSNLQRQPATITGGKPPLLPRKHHQVLDLGADAEWFIGRMVVMAGHEA